MSFKFDDYEAGTGVVEPSLEESVDFDVFNFGPESNLAGIDEAIGTPDTTLPQQSQLPPEALETVDSLFQDFPATDSTYSDFANVPEGEEPYFGVTADPVSTLGGKEKPDDTAKVLWEDVIKPTPARAAAQVVGGVGGGLQFAGDVSGSEQLVKTGKILHKQAAEVEQQINLDHPLKEGSWSQAAAGALSSIYMQGPFMAAGKLAAGIKAAADISLLGISGVTAGQTYGKRKESGFGITASALSSLWDGSVEYLTEKLPMEALMTIMKPANKAARKSVMATVGKYFGGEFGGEAIATLLQDANEKIMSDPKLTPEQRYNRLSGYLTSGEAKDNFLQTMKTVAIQSPLMMLGANTVRALSPSAPKEGKVDISQRIPEQELVSFIERRKGELLAKEDAGTITADEKREAADLESKSPADMAKGYGIGIDNRPAATIENDRKRVVATLETATTQAEVTAILAGIYPADREWVANEYYPKIATAEQAEETAAQPTIEKNIPTEEDPFVTLEDVAARETSITEETPFVPEQELTREERQAQLDETLGPIAKKETEKEYAEVFAPEKVAEKEYEAYQPEVPPESPEARKAREDREAEKLKEDEEAAEFEKATLAELQAKQAEAKERKDRKTALAIEGEISAREKEDARIAEEVESILPEKERKALRKEAESLASEDPVFANMQAARTATLNLSQLYKDYDKDTIREITKKLPAIFSLNGRTNPDEFAEEHGYESTDDMIEAFKAAPSKKALVEKIYNQKVKEWFDAETAMNEAVAKEEENAQEISDTQGRAETEGEGRPGGEGVGGKDLQRPEEAGAKAGEPETPQAMAEAKSLEESYVETEIKETDGGFDRNAVKKYAKTFISFIDKKINKNTWVSGKDIGTQGPYSRLDRGRGVSAAYSDLSRLKRKGLLDVAYDINGDTYYAKKGESLPGNLISEGDASSLPEENWEEKFNELVGKRKGGKDVRAGEEEPDSEAQPAGEREQQPDIGGAGEIGGAEAVGAGTPETAENGEAKPFSEVAAGIKEEPEVRELEVTEQGQLFKTGTPVTFSYVHNKESATKIFGKPKKGARFGRYFEPSGKYVTATTYTKTAEENTEQFETGQITFQNPLVVDNDNLNWKEAISNQYNGKRGKALSNALIADGYDGVVTIEKDHTSEILDLTSFDETKALFAKIVLEDRNLYTAHNLSADNLRHALELGGIAAPSLAISRSDTEAFTSFGDITLLADPNILFSPKTKTFDADIYSPRHPQVVHVIDWKALEKLKSSFGETYGLDTPGSGDLEESRGLDRLIHNDAFKLAWLRDNGVKIVTKKVKVSPAVAKISKLEGSSYALENNNQVKKIAKETATKDLAKLPEDLKDEFNKRWFEEDGSASNSYIFSLVQSAVRHRDSGGVDLYELKKAIAKKFRNKNLSDKFEKHARSTFDGLVKDRKIFKGFSATGMRRYSPYTLDNIVKEMTRELRGGEGFNYGAGSVRSAFAKRFKNLAQVKADRTKIVSNKEMAKIKDESQEKLFELLEELRPFYKYDANSFGYLDDASQAISEGARGLRDAFNNLDSDMIDKINEFTDYLRNLPTAYFESKMQRAVDISEFNAAVVPKGTDKELVETLKNKGLKVKFYDKRDSESRLETVRKTAILFAKGEPAAPKSTVTAITGEIDKLVNKSGRRNLNARVVQTVDTLLETIGMGTKFSGGIRKRIGGVYLSSPRAGITAVRGGWTKEKIRKELKQINTSSGKLPHRYIAQFDSPQELKDHIFYHGTGGWVDNGLKPSITMSERQAEQRGGGGYGERYWAISVSKDKEVASNFTGQSSSGTIYPIILKKEANVISRPDLEDASELDDIIVELWEQGVDAVRLGNWDSEYSEQELAILNPRAIFTYKNPEHFAVYKKKKFIPLTDDQIKEIYTEAVAGAEKLGEIRGSGLSKEEKDALVSELPQLMFSANEEIQGAFDPKTGNIYLVADNVAKEEVWPLLLHEGVHKVKSEKGWSGVFGNRTKEIMRRVDEKLKNNDPAWKAAEQKAIDAETPAKDLREETITYFLADKTNAKQPLWRRIYNAIKAFLVRIGFTRNISDADIVAVAEAAVRRQAKTGTGHITAAGMWELAPKAISAINEFAQDTKVKLSTATKNILQNPKFRAWFGDSKVVDDKGQPLVVYHGTAEEVFDSFDSGENVEWFGPPEVAGLYSEMGEDRAGDIGESAYGKTYPVYLAVQNPFIPEAGVTAETEIKSKDEYERITGVKYGMGQFFSSPLWLVMREDGAFKKLQSLGYDGVKWMEEGHITYGAFSPTQIKSIFNPGEFSTTDDRILFSKEEESRVAIEPDVSTDALDVAAKKLRDFIRSQAKPVEPTGMVDGDLFGGDSLYPSPGKGGGDSRVPNSEDAGNLLKGDTFASHGYSGLDIPSKRLVATSMLSVLHDNKILDSIVQLIPVDMVDILASGEFPAEVSLHDKTMLLHESPVDKLAAIAARIDMPMSDLIRITAFLTTKDFSKSSGDARGWTLKDLLAPRASQGDASPLVDVPASGGTSFIPGPFGFSPTDYAVSNIHNLPSLKVKRIYNTTRGEDGQVVRPITSQTPASQPMFAKAKPELEITEESTGQAIKNEISRRQAGIRNIRDYLGLTDDDLRKISSRDVRLMSEAEFQEFKDNLYSRAVEFADHRQKKLELLNLIFTRRLEKVENLQQALGLPSISKMDKDQLDMFFGILSQYDYDDVFLTVRQLERVDLVPNLAGVKTWREVKDKISEETGMSVEDLSKIKFSWRDDYRWDATLYEQSPFYKLLVGETTDLIMGAQIAYHQLEQEYNRLARLSDKSRSRGIVGRVIPQDKTLFEYMGTGQGERKDALAKKMTKEQLDLAAFMQNYLSIALDYLVATEALERGRKDYIPHMGRSFLEGWKDDGLKSAINGLFDSYRKDQEILNILAGKTSKILPMEKFFAPTQRRTGALTPSKNVHRVFLAYAQMFEKKKALDILIPKMVIYTRALTPEKETPLGLEFDTSLRDFVNEYINNKKGRRADFGKKLPQGGKIDVTLGAMMTLTSVIDLGGSVAVGAASLVGEQFSNYVMLGGFDWAKGLARMRTAKGKEILEKNKAFTGRGLWEEITEPGQEPQANLMKILFGMFHINTVASNKQFLLGSLTDEEYNSGNVSTRRLAEIQLNMGRFRAIPGTASVVGSTSLGRAGMQYKRWAAPILSSTIKDIKAVTSQHKGTERLTSRESREIYRIIALTAIALALASMAGDEEDTLLDKTIAKMRRESLSLIQGLDSSFWLSAPRVMSFLISLGKNIKQIATLEEYKTKPGYKGVEGIKRQFTPKLIKQFIPKEETGASESTAERGRPTARPRPKPVARPQAMPRPRPRPRPRQTVK